MRAIRISLLSGIVLFLLGCGHVAANYPVERARKPKELPKTYSLKGTMRNLSWIEPGEVHGFTRRIVSTQEFAEKMRRFADGGSDLARSNARAVEPMVKSGLYYCRSITFLAENVERSFRKGDFLITFADGTQDRDLGALVFPNRGATGEPEWTSVRKVTIRGVDDPEMGGWPIFIFLAPEHAKKTLQKIEWVPGVS